MNFIMSTVNIPAILIANGMGLAILFVVAIGNIWRTKEATGENKCLLAMFFCSAINCIVDPICFLADGKIGMINRILVIGCNTFLYLNGIITAFSWVFLVSYRLKNKLHPVHKTFLIVLLVYTFVTLFVNLFVPFVFSTDVNNVYSREFGYWIHNILYFIFTIDGLILYLKYNISSGGLKFFPAWAFIIPSAIGLAIQILFYGISTATPFTTVSIVCVILCMQNEYMLRDKLTGLYNRFYLNLIENKLKRYSNLKYSAIMLDINGFKRINDTFGHKIGDEALIKVSHILNEAVGKIGEVVRYAGDEFIIILNTQNNDLIKEKLTLIDSLLNDFNTNKTNQYELSLSRGYCILDFSTNTMDEYMDKIDELMYENKKQYYESHSRYDV